MLVNIHILQNYAPSNLNRDDTGSPKDTVFGGVLRARTSSQSLKRSMRRSEQFRDEFADEGLLAQRTRRFPTLLQARLEALDLDPEAVKSICRRAVEIGRESTRGRTEETDDSDASGEEAEVSPAAEAVLQTKQLIFLSDAELDTVAQKLAGLYQQMGAKSFNKAKIDDIARELRSGLPRSVDIAMFGRMTTSAAFQDVEASVQVAHAISTHRIEQEFDYYTAVDDISGESGAGFIGDTPFNSATYYKYLNVHWEGLLENLGGDAGIARRAVLALVKSACTVHPTGKQNSFAAHNLPDFVLVEVWSRNVPVSYANAFQKPVRATPQTSLMEASVQALASYVQKVNALYDLQSESAYITTLDEKLPEATACESLNELLAWLQLRLNAAGKVAAV